MGQKHIVRCAISGQSERRQVFEMSDPAGVYFEKWLEPTEVWWLELPQNRTLSCMSFTRYSGLSGHGKETGSLRCTTKYRYSENP